MPLLLTRPTTVGLLTGIAVLTLLSACKDEKKQPPQMGQMPPAEVFIKEMKPADVALLSEYAGRTAGSREVEVRARVGGILLQRAYVEGQKVKQGDVLFKIDPDPFIAAQAETDARLKEATRDWKRVSELYKEKAVSARDRDQSLSNYEQAQAMAKTARINLNYTTVQAPITGVTSKEARSEGSLIGMTNDNSLLTEVTQLDPLYVNFAYPDSEVLLMKQGVDSGKYILPENKKLTAMIRFGDGTTYPKAGYVDFTDSMIDPDTGSVRARAVIPNPDGSLLPGQFVRVVVKGVTEHNAYTVPDRAIMQGPQGTFVYVVNPENKAGIKPVQLGELINGDERIVEGLKQGDKVIVEGMIKVKPDAPVKIGDPNAKPDATTSGAPVNGAPATGAPATGAPSGVANSKTPHNGTAGK